MEMKTVLSIFYRLVYLVYIVAVITCVCGAVDETVILRSDERRALPSIINYGTKRIVCKDGWTPAIISGGKGPVPQYLCLKLYRKPASWHNAKDECRSDNAFLLKMENKILVGATFLDTTLHNEGIPGIWSGLHVDESKLVWDETKPSVFQPALGDSETFYALKRGWKWQLGSFQEDSDKCGLFTTGLKTRKVRSTGKVEEEAAKNNTETKVAGRNEAPISLTDKIIDLIKEAQDETQVLSATTPTPPSNSTESVEDTTDATSKEDTTEFTVTETTEATVTETTESTVTEDVSDVYDSTKGHDNITDTNTTTIATTTLDHTINKRSTSLLNFLASTTFSPSFTTNSKHINTLSTVSSITGAPILTASAPAKGTSFSTAVPDLSELFDLSSSEITESILDLHHEDIDGFEEEDAKRTSAATKLEPTQFPAFGSQVANPVFVTLADSIANRIKSIKPRMELEDCEVKHPYICYSDPVEKLMADPHCGNEWISHNSLNKCYRVVQTAQTRDNAAKNCVTLGGKLADAAHHFYGNITALAFNLHPRRLSLGTQAWVEAVDGGKVDLRMCDAIVGYKLQKVNCATNLPSVCEKPVPDSDFGDTKGFEEFLYTPDKMQVLYMSSTKPGTLLCPLRSSSPEDLILWYKDGVLIQDVGSIYFGSNSNQFIMNNQNRFSSTLKLDNTLFQRLGKNKASLKYPAMLQGKYWCEVWRRKPFHKIKSMKYLVRYTDVITLFGTIQTKHITSKEAALFNYMNTPFGVPQAINSGLMFCNTNITRVLRPTLPLFKNAVSKLINVDSDNGRVEFHTYISLTRDLVSEKFKSNVVKAYLKNLHGMILANSATISTTWNTLPDVGKSVFLSRTDVCQSKYLEDDETELGAHFPTTSVNSSTASTEICDGQPAGTAHCMGNLEERAYWHEWVVNKACKKIIIKPSSEEFIELEENGDEIEPLNGPSIFQPLPTANPGLAQLDQIEIEDGNVGDVSDKMAEIMEHAESLNEEDVTRISKVIERINKIVKPSFKVGENIIRTVNKVLEAKEDVLDDAEEDDHSTARILTNMEEIANKADLGNNKNVRLVTPNVAMEIWDLDELDVPVIGLGAMVADSWAVPLSNPRIMTIRNRSDEFLHDFDVAIELPESVVRDRMNDNNSTRLSMFIYRKVGLFSSKSSNQIVNSPIISASVGGQKIEHLQDRVRMIFRPFKDSVNRANATRCVYWDFSLNKKKGGWSGEGCQYAGTLYNKDVCLCDHLTNFAILLDFYGHSNPIAPVHDFALSIITIVGLSLSIFGLGMTIVTFVFFSKLRHGRAQQTLFHMAMSLFGSELVFLIGIKQTEHYGVCLGVAVLLHYFILVSFMWMLVEAILQYLTFVKVLGTYISRYTLKTALPAWGIPILPVCIVLCIDYNLYKGRDNYCWMNLDAFYYAFALPVGLIIVFNAVMFIIIIISLGTRPRGLRAHQPKTNNSNSKTNLKAAITIFVLLGLTWMFGYLAIADARLVFQYLFTFLSSLQGFFIFILMVARRKQIRDQWAIICCRDVAGDRKRKSVSATNSNSTSSNSSGGSGASRRSLFKKKSRNGSIETIVSERGFDSLYFIPTSSIPTKNLNFNKSPKAEERLPSY